MKWGKLMTWFDTTGGPTIVMPIEKIQFWYGTISQEEDKLSDYDKACMIDDDIGILSVMDGTALVLWDEPYSTTWYTDNSRQLSMFIRWIAAPDEEAVLSIVSEFDVNDFVYSDIKINLATQELVLFDSSYAGFELSSDEMMKIEILPSIYEIDTMEYKQDDVWLIFHRLRLIEK